MAARLQGLTAAKRPPQIAAARVSCLTSEASFLTHPSTTSLTTKRSWVWCVVTRAGWCACMPFLSRLSVTFSQPSMSLNKLIAAAGEHGAFQRLERGELDVDSFAEPFERECVAAGFSGVSALEFVRHRASLFSHTHSLTLTRSLSLSHTHTHTHTHTRAMQMNRVLGAIKPRPLMLECMQSLRQQGFAVGILTNNFNDAGKSSEMASMLSEYADVVVESAKEGLRKPDPRIYELVCDRMKLPPQQLVYVSFRACCSVLSLTLTTYPFSPLPVPPCSSVGRHRVQPQARQGHGHGHHSRRAGRPHGRTGCSQTTVCAGHDAQARPRQVVNRLLHSNSLCFLYTAAPPPSAPHTVRFTETQTPATRGN